MLDGHDITDLESRLRAAEEALHQHTASAAEAVQVKTFAKRMEASLLAKYEAPHLRNDKPPSVAKTLAMADEGYQQELAELKAVFQLAQQKIEEQKVAVTKWETARSLLSMAKAQIQPSFHSTRSQQG